MASPFSDKTLSFLAARFAGALGAPNAVLMELLENGDNLEYLDRWIALEALAKSGASHLLAEFLTAGVEVFDKEPFLASELVSKAVRRPALDAVVERIVGSSKHPAHALGAFLHRNQGISVSGWHIENVGDRRGSTLWALVPLE